MKESITEPKERRGKGKVERKKKEREKDGRKEGSEKRFDNKKYK